MFVGSRSCCPSARQVTPLPSPPQARCGAAAIARALLPGRTKARPTSYRAAGRRVARVAAVADGDGAARAREGSVAGGLLRAAVHGRASPAHGTARPWARGGRGFDAGGASRRGLLPPPRRSIGGRSTVCLPCLRSVRMRGREGLAAHTSRRARRRSCRLPGVLIARFVIGPRVRCVAQRRGRLGSGSPGPSWHSWDHCQHTTVRGVIRTRVASITQRGETGSRSGHE